MNAHRKDTLRLLLLVPTRNLIIRMPFHKAVAANTTTQSPPEILSKAPGMNFSAQPSVIQGLQTAQLQIERYGRTI